MIAKKVESTINTTIYNVDVDKLFEITTEPNENFYHFDECVVKCWVHRQMYSQQRIVRFTISGNDCDGVDELCFEIFADGSQTSFERLTMSSEDLRDHTRIIDLSLGRFFTMKTFEIRVQTTTHFLQDAFVLDKQPWSFGQMVSLPPKNFDVFLTFKRCATDSSDGNAILEEDDKLKQFLVEKDGRLGIWVHKDVLSDASPVFKAMFSESEIETREKQTNVVELSLASGKHCSQLILCFIVALVYFPDTKIGSHNRKVESVMIKLYQTMEKTIGKKRPFKEEEEKCKGGEEEEKEDKKGGEEEEEESGRSFDWSDPDQMEKTKKMELKSRTNGFCNGNRLETVMFPILDIMHQYQFQRVLNRIEKILCRSVCELTIHRLYEWANMFKFRYLQKVCAYYATDALHNFKYYGKFDSFDEWNDERHERFAQFVCEEL